MQSRRTNLREICCENIGEKEFDKLSLALCSVGRMTVSERDDNIDTL